MTESELDQALSSGARAELRALYAQAQVRTIANAGHAVLVTYPTQYIGAIRAFPEAA